LGHLVSVGTSLLRNGVRRLVSCVDGGGCGFDSGVVEGVVGFVEDCLRASVGSGDDLECLRVASGWGEVHRVLYDLVSGDPYRMSAELNAMRPWLESAAAGDSWSVGLVVLYPTSTGAGVLAGRVLQRYLASVLPEGVSVELEPVEGFERGVWPGLAGLAGRVREGVRRVLRAGGVAMLNATGGFKPESGFMILAGLLHASGKSYAYYIHELHREPTVIPLASRGHLECAARRLAESSRRGEHAGAMIRLPPEEAVGECEWLRDYARILSPLGKSRVLEDGSLLFDPNIALALARVSGG